MTPQEIVKLRRDLDLTQRELAKRIGAQQSTVARWELGSHRPRGAYLKALKELQAKAKTKPK